MKHYIITTATSTDSLGSAGFSENNPNSTLTVESSAYLLSQSGGDGALVTGFRSVIVDGLIAGYGGKTNALTVTGTARETVTIQGDTVNGGINMCASASDDRFTLSGGAITGEVKFGSGSANVATIDADVTAIHFDAGPGTTRLDPSSRLRHRLPLHPSRSRLDPSNFRNRRRLRYHHRSKCGYQVAPKGHQ